MDSKSKAMKIDNNNGNQQDFFSLLPDELIHYILSFLDMTFVVQTSILSKRWRYIWSSLRILNFTVDYLNIKVPVLFSLFLRRGTYIKTFRIRNKNPNRNITRGQILFGTPNYVSTWTHVAVLNNVEELDLQISCGNKKLKFSHCLFTCKSLTTLKLDMGLHPFLNFPDTIDLPSLRNVHLIHVRFHCKGISNFVSRCPVLERLTINDCSLTGRAYNLVISSLRLKELDVKLTDSRPGYCNVTVSAPRLVSFSCTGDAKMHAYNLVDISSLVRAEMELWPKANKEESKWTSENVERVIMCLKEVSAVRSLTVSISAKMLKALFDVPVGLGGVTSFCNLSVLKLKAVISRFSVSCVMYLLEKCPILETFILITDKHPLQSDSKDLLDSWRTELQLECMHHLKLIDFKGFNGSVIELKFLKFFLENAMVLEKMTICKSNKVQSVVSEGRESKHQLDIKEPDGRGSTFIEVVYGRSTIESKPKTKNQSIEDGGG